MTHEQKINYMRIACNLCRYGFDNKQIDLMASLYDMIIEKGGNATMRDTAEVESAVEKRAMIKKRFTKILKEPKKSRKTKAKRK